MTIATNISDVTFLSIKDQGKLGFKIKLELNRMDLEWPDPQIQKNLIGARQEICFHNLLVPFKTVQDKNEEKQKKIPLAIHLHDHVTIENYNLKSHFRYSL